jgi:hypothetical protein
VDERTYELFAQLADRGDWVSRTSGEAEGSALAARGKGGEGGEGARERESALSRLPWQILDETDAHLVRAKLCKTAVELDRMWWVRQADPSYNVSLFRMWGMDDPPFSKTDMLVGWPGLGALRSRTDDAL